MALWALSLKVPQRGVSTQSKVPKVPLFIGGQFVESKATKWTELTNPATNEVIGLVPETTQEEMLQASAAAAAAFPEWRKTPVSHSTSIMFKFAELIRQNQGDLALNVVKEQGKTLVDAQGDVFRGLQVVEHATGMGTLLMGETVENVG